MAPASSRERMDIKGRLAFTGMMIGITACRATLPVSVSLILWRQWQRLRLGTVRGLVDLLKLWMRHSFRLWLSVEAYFYIWFLLQFRRLSRVDIHVAPVRRRDGGLGGRDTRPKLLERFLAALDESRGQEVRAMSRESSQILGRRADARIGERQGVGLLNVRKSFASTDMLLHQLSMTSMVPSAENLLRLVGDNCELDDEDEDVVQLGFRHAELSGWFFYAPISEITKGNLAEWIVEYFFNGMPIEELRKDSEMASDLSACVECCVHWAKLDPYLSEKPNPNVRCMRLTRDPLIASHRPFWAYAITEFALPRVTRALLSARGFKRYRAGSLVYWRRRATSPKTGRMVGGARSPGNTVAPAPLVFCHGLGVGVLPYIGFVMELCKACPESDMFCVDLPHIQLRPREEVPSAREVCACIGDMLHAWGYRAAHFVGHSFGTLVCAWVVRYAASELALSVSLIDPVCFLLCKSDLLYNALYCPRNPFTDIRSYCLCTVIFRELFVSHALMRNFFWVQNNLWPNELLQVPSLVVLSGRDRLVPSHSVRAHLCAEVERRRLMREACQSGGNVVIQTSDHITVPRPGAACNQGTVNGLSIHVETPPISNDAPRADPAPLQLRFFSDADHGQFWGDPDMKKDVADEVGALICGCRHYS